MVASKVKEKKETIVKETIVKETIVKETIVKEKFFDPEYLDSNKTIWYYYSQLTLSNSNNNVE